jgi:hypothetical protein
VRVHRAEAVRARQIGAGLGAEDHRGARAIELAIEVAGVAEGAPRDLEAEQLHRLDGVERARRDAVGQRIERDVVEEAAPLARRLLAGARAGRGRVEVGLDAPPLRRDLADRVHAADDVAPERVGIGRARHDRGEPDDRDVGGGGGRGRARRVLLAMARRRRDQRRGAALADLAVQLGDRAGRAAQRRDLADHEHALVALHVVADRGDHGAVAAQALGGDAQPPEVELLERGPHLLRRDARRLHALLLLGEGGGERGVGAAGGVTGPGLEQDGALARDRRLLEAGLDGTARDRLVGEQVRGAHQHADLGAARRQRRGHRGDHRRRAAVVDAAGEQHAQLLGRRVREQPLDLQLPQREARARPDMAAALATLEDEAAGAVAQEQIEQPRRRHVQVRQRALPVERRRLRRPPAGDQRDRRRDLAQDGELRVADLLRHEAEDADAPGPVADQRGGLAQELAHLVAAHQGQREERQPAGLGDRGGEARPVADARHRPLRDRIPHAVRGGERRAGRERRLRAGRLEVTRELLAEPSHHTAGGREALRERARERALLPDREQAGREIVAAEPRAHLVGGRARHPGHRQVRPRVHAIAADHDGLAAVHRADRAADLGAQRRLAHQRELTVEHDAGGAAGDARRRGVHADAALDPDRQVDRRDQLLQQHERGLLADTPARLGALRDDAVGAGRHRGARLVERRHLHDHRARLVARHAGDRADDHDVDLRGQIVGGELDAGGNAHAEATRQPPLQHRERVHRGGAIASEIEDAERPGVAQRRDEPGIRPIERTDTDHPGPPRFRVGRHQERCGP